MIIDIDAIKQGFFVFISVYLFLVILSKEIIYQIDKAEWRRNEKSKEDSQLDSTSTPRDFEEP